MTRLRRLAFAGLTAFALKSSAPCAETPASPATPKAPLVDTVIESGSAEMVSTDKETTFTFSKGVTVTATNMKMASTDLVVISRRSGDAAATIGKQNNFKSLVATGAVHILQDDREVFCDRAEVFPDEDKVVITGNPATWRTLDGQYKGSGPTFELLRGERRIIMPKATFTLPPLKDLGYDKVPEKKQAAPGTVAPKSEAPKPDRNPPPPNVTVPLPAAPK